MCSWLPLPVRGETANRIGTLLICAASIGFAASVISGMLYKIVPFLTGFHLKTQTGAKVGAISNMKELIPDRLKRLHFRRR